MNNLSKKNQSLVIADGILIEHPELGLQPIGWISETHSWTEQMWDELLGIQSKLTSIQLTCKIRTGLTLPNFEAPEGVQIPCTHDEFTSQFFEKGRVHEPLATGTSRILRGPRECSNSNHLAQSRCHVSPLPQRSRMDDAQTEQ